MSNIKHSLLVSIKNRMTAAYKREDWQILAELDKECQQTVSQIISDEPRAMFDELREMLGFYAQLIEDCEEQRNQYASELKQMRQTIQHRDVYADLDQRLATIY